LRLNTVVQDGVAIICVEGEVDLSNAVDLRDASLAALSDGASSLVVDCTELTFIDSTGLGALISAYREAHERLGSVTIRHATPMMLRVLETTGLDEFLTVEQ
jgi:anti-sigma B factor antagonist